MGEKKSYWLMSVLSVILILRIMISLVSNDLDFFWLCVVNLFVLILAIYKNNTFLFSVVLVASLIPEFFRTIDVLAYLSTGTLVFNVANYIPQMTTLSFIISFYHLFLVIIPGYVLLKQKKYDSRAWLGASLLLLAAALASFMFTSSNANCVRDFCDFGVFNHLYALKYPFIPFLLFHWLIATVFVFLPTHVFLNWFFNTKKASRE